MRAAVGKANKGLIGGVLGIAAALAFFLVPIRTCESCHGVAGFKIGDVVDLTCRGCGGDGKQTAFDIVRAAVRR